MPLQQSPFGKIRRIHFIGIGGIGMSGIARLCHHLGYAISGSDLKSGEMTKDLEKLGIQVFYGHREENIRDAQVVVTSSAVSPANEELLFAKENGLPVIQRGEMLAELMRLRYGIAIAGTHGKTTTTAMVSAILMDAGLSPTSVIGGKWAGIGTNAELGKSQLLVCESDESDGSFLKLSPVVTVVTNIDLDHMDFYHTEENLLLHFLQFINKTPFFGKAILCVDDNRVRALLPEIQKPKVTYGFSEDAQIRAKQIRFENAAMTFEVEINIKDKPKDLGTFRLKVPGKHNVLNSLAALAVALELEVPVETIKRSMETFQGVNRRMTVVGNWRGFTVIDDYGHHPTEIKATFEAIRYQTKKLIAIFQPHRYSRTIELYKEFAEALSTADEIYLMEIYPAGEEAPEGVTSAMIANRLKKHPKVFYLPKVDDLIQTLKQNHPQGDGVILTIGAGDVTKIGPQILKEN
jgi:UDP-N-acetylmuramate--alanine ligase